MTRKILTCLTLLTLLIGLSIFSTQAQEATSLMREDVTFMNGDITLEGTLTLPANSGPHPAIIVISGSGEQNRDGETVGFMPGYAPSRFLAEALTPEGFAVLRYDERGVGDSTGVHYAATSADFADDVEAAIDYLRTRDDIDNQQIGLIGHSEGSNIVAIVAARNPHVAFVISMAGQAVNGYDLLVEQTIAGAEANGATQEQIDAAVEMGRNEWNMVLAQDWDALAAYSRDRFAAMPEDKRPDADVQEALIEQQETFARNWFSFFLQYNPAEDWVEVDVPVLAVFAELDTQVTVEQNRTALETALEASDNEDFTIVTLEDTNHLFQPGAETGAPEEYSTLETTFTPALLSTLINWLHAHVTF